MAYREAACTQLDTKNDLPGWINIAFADKHVELVRLERLWNLTWHRNWAAPASDLANDPSCHLPTP